MISDGLVVSSKIKDAAELQVVADDLGKELGVGLGVIGARGEIGYGYARLFDT